MLRKSWIKEWLSGPGPKTVAKTVVEIFREGIWVSVGAFVGLAATIYAYGLVPNEKRKNSLNGNSTWKLFGNFFLTYFVYLAWCCFTGLGAAVLSGYAGWYCGSEPFLTRALLLCVVNMSSGAAITALTYALAKDGSFLLRLPLYFAAASVNLYYDYFHKFFERIGRRW